MISDLRFTISDVFPKEHHIIYFKIIIYIFLTKCIKIFRRVLKVSAFSASSLRPCVNFLNHMLKDFLVKCVKVSPQSMQIRTLQFIKGGLIKHD